MFSNVLVSFLSLGSLIPPPIIWSEVTLCSFIWIKYNVVERRHDLIQLKRNKLRTKWADMEVPSESFCRSSWDSRTCYPWRTTNQGLTDDEWADSKAQDECEGQEREIVMVNLPVVHFIKGNVMEWKRKRNGSTISLCKIIHREVVFYLIINEPRTHFFHLCSFKLN